MAIFLSKGFSDFQNLLVANDFIHAHKALASRIAFFDNSTLALRNLVRGSLPERFQTL